MGCLRFDVVSAKKSFSIYAYDFEQKQSWVEVLRKLNKIETLMCKKNKIQNLLLKMYAYVHYYFIQHYVLARPDPIWMDDSGTDSCLLCYTKFTLTNRRVIQNNTSF